MIAALVVRRFTVPPTVIEAERLLDLPALPAHGDQLVFEDGSGDAVVAGTRVRAWPAPRPTGAYPVAVEIRTETEPGERLEQAVKAGWARRGETAEGTA